MKPSQRIPFAKLHGCGNSFVVVDDRAKKLSGLAKFAHQVCRADIGIGSDGLIVVRNHATADFEMLFFNPDGSRAEMCGNGIRCLAAFLLDTRATSKKKLFIKTGAGTIGTRIASNRRYVASNVRVAMGPARFHSSDVVYPNQKPAPLHLSGYEFHFVSMGNPHVVTFVKKIPPNITTIGPQVENARCFPRRTNVEFVEVTGANTINLVVWERGAGLTKACGTGAAAAAVAAIKTGRVSGSRVRVMLPGGELKIEWHEKENQVFLTGPAVTVAHGVLSIRGH